MNSREAYQEELVNWWSFRDSRQNNSLTGTLFLFFFIFPFYSFTFPQAFKDVSITLMFFQPTHFNCVTGEIPHSLFNISRLKFLNLAVNNLKGEIPSTLPSRAPSFSIII